MMDLWHFADVSLAMMAVLLVARTVFFAVVSGVIKDARVRRWLKRPSQRLPKHEDQLCESIWYTLVYGVLLTWGLLALRETSAAWYEGEFLWARADGRQAHDFHTDVAGHDVARLYLFFQVAFFAHELISLFFLTVEKKDWLVQATHHVVTCILLTLSMSMGFHRVSLLTLLIHDVSDVFMWLAKATKYMVEMSAASPHRDDALVSVFFVIFATSFYYARFFLLPMNVIVPSLTLWRHHSQSAARIVCMAGLVILQCLHVVWGYMILQIVYRKVWLGRDIDDVRSIDKREHKSK